MIRVLVGAVSDVARAGLGSLLGGIPEVEVVGRAGDADDLARLIRSLAPDVVLLEVPSRDEDAAALLSVAAELSRGPALVILADEPLEFDQPDGRPAGGLALLPRRSGAAEIDAAIRAAAAGLIVTHPDFALREARVTSAPLTLDNAILTPREIEVLRMLAAGLPNKSIANRLGVSAHTVKFHVGSIMAKLHASSRTEAVTEGIRRGLIFL
jgi:two-component system, NarL family, response regulator YdfI